MRARRETSLPTTCPWPKRGSIARTRSLRASLRVARLAAFLWLGTHALPACRRSLAHPPYAPQPASALVEVSATPPPGRIEVIPPRPNRSAVWIDGEWSWHRQRWAWVEGRWVDPPPAASFSPWVFERGTDGRMWYAPGIWRRADGAPIDPPPPLASAHVEPTQIVNASGAVETTGPTRSAPAPGSATADGGRS